MQRKTVSIVINENDSRKRDVDRDFIGSNYRSQLSRTKHRLMKPPSVIRGRRKYICDSLARKILLIQDILYEFPELETNVTNSISGYKQKPSKGITARVLSFIFSALLVLVLYSAVFLVGMIIASNLLTPVPITGTVMTNYFDDNMENDLQKIILIPPTEESGLLKVKGTFKVAYNVYNNTLFSGSLSVYMNVSYLPQSGSRSDNRRCFDESVYKYVYKYTYSNVKSGELDFFSTTEYEHIDASESDEDILKKKRSGSLITLEKVEHEKNIGELPVHVLETTAYNAFTSHRLASNKIDIIPRINRGFNKVVLLVTLESTLDPDKNPKTDGYLARRMYYDCQKNGYLTLKFDASLQKFDTMVFTSNLLPTTFLPVVVKCFVTSDVEVVNKIEDIAVSQRRLYNRQQYILKKLNTALNM